jgi:hypothetical protein
VTYRKQLTVLVAEESDIQEGTEFYAKDEVSGIIDDIEREVGNIKEVLEDYKEWPLEEIESKLGEIYKKIGKLADNLY